MKWRWIAAIVCTLYLGVGVVIGATHDHAGHSLAGDEGCAACAWHHDGQGEVPSAGLAVVAPQATVLHYTARVISVFEVAVGLHRGRGPPLVSQL